MEDLITKFNELPENAQYVIYGAGGLIGLLLVVLLIAVILSISKGSRGGDKAEKVKVPKRLPIAPVEIMSDREHALHRVLIAALASFPEHEVHAKVSTVAMLGPRDEEHPKVAKAIMAKLIHDTHDFVIVDRSRFPVAVVELDSQEGDEREEQARRAGLPIVRVKNPRVSSREMAERLKGVLQ